MCVGSYDRDSTKYWDINFCTGFPLLPPGGGRWGWGGMGGLTCRAATPLHPHPRPPPSRGRVKKLLSRYLKREVIACPLVRPGRSFAERDACYRQEVSCLLLLFALPWYAPRRRRSRLPTRLLESAPYLRQFPICGLQISRLSSTAAN